MSLGQLDSPLSLPRKKFYGLANEMGGCSIPRTSSEKLWVIQEYEGFSLLNEYIWFYF
jgi:hypothetical protein